MPGAAAVVPLTTPAEETLMPAGKVPVSSRQLCGATPPVMASVCENGALWIAVALALVLLVLAHLVERGAQP